MIVLYIVVNYFMMMGYINFLKIKFPENFASQNTKGLCSPSLALGGIASALLNITDRGYFVLGRGNGV